MSLLRSWLAALLLCAPFVACRSEAQRAVTASVEVGAIAPDISGIDLDGVAFKLSDYKGKVVFLDFWGDW